MQNSNTVVFAGPVEAARRKELEQALGDISMRTRFVSYGETDSVFKNRETPRFLITLPAPTMRGSFETLDIGALDAHFDIELHGRFDAAQSCVKAAGEAGCALLHIVNADGLIGGQGNGLGATAAMAALGLSRSIALDHRDRPVRSNALALAPDWDAEDLAALSAFLFTGKGREMSGQVLALSKSTVHICSQPRPLRVGHRENGWRQEEVAALVSTSWQGALLAHESASEAFSL